MADETPVVVAPKATIYVERKVQVRDYESLVVGMHYPVDLPLPEVYGEDGLGYLQAIDGSIKAAYVTVKAHIFEQLGLEFEDRNGVLIEKLAAKFEGAAEVQASPRPQAQRSTQATAPAASDTPKCEGCGGTDLWDNRPKKASGQYKPNAADFKCKNKSCGKSIWLTKKGSN